MVKLWLFELREHSKIDSGADKGTYGEYEPVLKFLKDSDLLPEDTSDELKYAYDYVNNNQHKYKRSNPLIIDWIESNKNTGMQVVEIPSDSYTTSSSFNGEGGYESVYYVTDSEHYVYDGVTKESKVDTSKVHRVLG